MKTTLKLIIAVLFMINTAVLTARPQESKNDKFESVSIKTSAVCGMCKDRLEKNIAFEKGVRSVSLDDETKVLTIEYRKGKNDKERLKKAISRLGYDADDLPADQKAHDRLPACCQKGNNPH